MARRTASRITKSTPPPTSSSRMTRGRSRLSSAGSSGGALQSMIDEVMSSQGQGPGSLLHGRTIKGKERLAEDEKSVTFPIMQLPTEIRLEIYRACLTRPKKILLSKVEKAPQSEGATVHGSEDEDHPTASQRSRRSGGSRAARHVPLRSVWARRSRHSRASSATLSNRSSSGTSTDCISSVSTLSSTNSVPTLTPTTSLTSEGAEPLSPEQPQSPRPRNDDELIINILRTSKEIYKEARDVLYSENIFKIDLDTAIASLAALHQRSRRHIKHIEVSIPTYTDILERFSEVVRLSLRYCTGLKTLVIRTPFTLPGTDGAGSVGNATVYANGFDILRWLPQQCQVVLEGCHNPEIDAVVSKHMNLARMQDKDKYASRMFAVQDDDCQLNTDGTWVDTNDRYAVPNPVGDKGVIYVRAGMG